MTDNAYTRRFLKDPPKTEQKSDIEGSVQVYEDKFGNELRDVDNSVDNVEKEDD